MADRWWADARCKERWISPEWFHPKRGGSPARALEVCRHCPVTAACLEDALADEAGRTGDPTGVRGGLTGLQRRPLVRQRRKAQGRQESANLRRMRRMADGGMTPAEIGREVGASAGAVSVQLRRAAERDRRVAA